MITLWFETFFGIVLGDFILIALTLGAFMICFVTTMMAFERWAKW